MTSGENDEEAAWLDLIANYDAPADIEGGSPWPERENLSEPDNAPIPGASQVTRSPQAPESPQATGPFPIGEAPPGIRPAAPADPLHDPDQPRPVERNGPGQLNGPGQPGLAARPGQPGPGQPGPGQPGPGHPGPGQPGPGQPVRASGAARQSWVTMAIWAAPAGSPAPLAGTAQAPRLAPRHPWVRRPSGPHGEPHGDRSRKRSTTSRPRPRRCPSWIRSARGHGPRCSVAPRTC